MNYILVTRSIPRSIPVYLFDASTLIPLESLPIINSRAAARQHAGLRYKPFLDILNQQVPYNGIIYSNDPFLNRNIIA